MVLPVLWGIALSTIALNDVRHADGRATFDQVLFHEHTIDSAARTWPVVHLTYPEHFVAMTPGFHWVLGGLVWLTGMSDPWLRLVALGMSVAMFSVLGARFGLRCGPLLGAALVAPILASVYVMNSAAWLLADNAGWFWVGVLSLGALWVRPDCRWAAIMGVGLLLAVWTRQNLLFLALPLWAAAWMRTEPDGPERLNPLTEFPRRLRHLAPMAIATLPAIATLVYLYRLWGGLVPHEFQGQYDGASPSNIALQLVMLGGLGVFFLPAVLGVGENGWRQGVPALLRRVTPWTLLGFVLAGVAAALVPTTHGPTVGRAGLIWSAADRLNPFGPIGHANPLTVLIAALGGAVLALLLAAAPVRQRWILAALYCGFAIAQGASSEVWQRYHEPFALVFLAIATTVAAGGRKRPSSSVPAAQIVPLAVLATALAVTSAMVLWQREIAPWRQGASQVPTSPGLPDPPRAADPGVRPTSEP